MDYFDFIQCDRHPAKIRNKEGNVDFFCKNFAHDLGGEELPNALKNDGDVVTGTCVVLVQEQYYLVAVITDTKEKYIVRAGEIE